MIDRAKTHWIDLSLVDGLGPAGFRALLTEFGLPEDVLGASRSALAQVVGPSLADAIKRNDRTVAIGSAIAWLEDSNHHLLSITDPDYLTCPLPAYQ